MSATAAVSLTASSSGARAENAVIRVTLSVSVSSSTAAAGAPAAENAATSYVISASYSTIGLIRPSISSSDISDVLRHGCSSILI